MKMAVGRLDFGSGYHVIATEFVIGATMIATLAVAARLLSKSERTAKIADSTAYFASAFAVVSLLAAMITGLTVTWGWDAVTWVMLTRNKIMFASFAVVAWGLFFALRYRFGSEIWQSRPLAASCAALAFLGEFSVITLGSLGAAATLRGSVIQDLWDAVGINTVHTIALPSALSYAIILLSLAALAGAYVTKRQPTA